MRRVVHCHLLRNRRQALWNTSEASFWNAALAWHKSVPVRSNRRSLSTSRASPLDSDVMWKLALTKDATVLAIGAYAVAFAPDASKTSSKNWR